LMRMFLVRAAIAAASGNGLGRYSWLFAIGGVAPGC